MKNVRRLRFSLRTLFLAVTCAAMFCAMALAIYQRGMRQRRAFERVYQLGGGATFEPNTSSSNAPSSNLEFCFRNVAMVNFSGQPINDEHIALVREFPRLKRLLLEGTTVDDQDLEQLQSLQHLEILILRDTPVSDAAVDRLRAKLPQCEIVTHVAMRCRVCRQFFYTRDVRSPSLCSNCD